MKKRFFLLLWPVLFISCQSNPDKLSEKTQVPLGDTITTESGLQYYFLKRGEGPKIDTGSKVYAFTDLYINDADTIFWTTAAEEDSSFVFIHGRTSLISGFSELNNYLREGDEVVAILPDSLAYGKSGRGGVPPAATLVYKPYVVRSVSEPKEMLNDTLQALNNKDFQSAIEFYEEVLHTRLSEKYHSELEDLMPFLERLEKDSLYQTLYDWVLYLEPKAKKALDKEYLSYYKIRVYEARNQHQEALNEVEGLLAGGADSSYWNGVKMELEEEIQKGN